MSAALFVLGVTIPSTPWIDQNRAIYVSIIAIGALVIGVALWFIGIRWAKSQSIKKFPLEEIKDNLIIIDKCEREIATKKVKEKYTQNSTKKVRADFTEYITNTAITLFKSLTDTSDMGRVLDSLIKFFVGISDILDSNGYGLNEVGWI